MKTKGELQTVHVLEQDAFFVGEPRFPDGYNLVSYVTGSHDVAEGTKDAKRYTVRVTVQYMEIIE